MIVVDDERIIREGLNKYISELNIGFEIVGTFEDGKEAIEYLEENKVDLIFTDIRMFEISGLELAEYVCRTSPDTAIVFLSGYKEFEYARQALMNNVLYYLLKPIKNEEIKNVLGNIKKKLDIDRINKRKIERFDEIVQQRRKQFFADHLFGAFIDIAECKKKFRDLEFPFSADNVFCTILKITVEDVSREKWLYGKDGLKTAINNYFLVYGEDAYYSIFLDTEECLVLSESVPNRSESIDKQLEKWLLSFCGVKTYVELEYTCKGIEDLRDYFSLKEKDNNMQNKEWILENKYRLLNTYITLKMEDEAKKLFEVILSELDIDSYSQANNIIKGVCKKITAHRNIDDHVYTEKLKNLSKNNISWSIAVQEIFEEIVEDIKHTEENNNDLITKIKEYVQKNYAGDITLDDVAGQVFLNSVYLSRYFKQHTGETFSDYLISIRIVNSIKLLKSGRYKIYEIAQMVGYGSSRYFSKLFKNYTGYTPKAYLKHIWNTDICE